MTDGTQTTASTATSNDTASATTTAASTAAVVDTKAATEGTSTATTETKTEGSTTKPLGADAVTTEVKTEGDKTKTETKEGDKPAEAVDLVSDTTEFKLPEGVSIDKEMDGEFKALAKGLKLPTAEAQKLVDLGSKLNGKFNEALTKQVTDQQAKWSQELRTDPELGGTELPAKLAIAQKGLNAFDPSGKLDKLLTETGLNNNVEVIRTLYKAGLTVKEDNLVNGDAGGAVQQSGGPGSLARAGSILYGNNKK